MKISSSPRILCLLASIAIAVCFVGCSGSESNSEKEENQTSEFDQALVLNPTPQDLAFAKEYGATWITTNVPISDAQMIDAVTNGKTNTSLPLTDFTFTVDFQDGLYSQGSTHACALWVDDVQRENGVLLLTGTSLSVPFNFEIEITPKMLAIIRAAGGKLSFIRLAFQVESFNRIESESNDSSEDSEDRYLLRGKAVAIEPIPQTESQQK